MEFKWEAEDQTLGMTADEMIRGIGKAKMVMGSSTRMTLSSRMGWKGQIKSVTAKAFEEDLTKVKDLTCLKSKDQQE